MLIVTGSVIGCCLDRSGAATTLAQAVLRLVGEQNAFVALSAIGVIISMAVSVLRRTECAGATNLRAPR